MKWLVKKLAKWLKVSIEVEKIVVREVEKTIYAPENGVIEGDVTVKGDLVVKGTLSVKGEVTCYRFKEENV